MIQDPSEQDIDLTYYMDVLKEYGYIVLPYDRYFSMIMYCALHNACGFSAVNAETGEECVSGRAN